MADVTESRARHASPLHLPALGARLEGVCAPSPGRAAGAPTPPSGRKS